MNHERKSVVCLLLVAFLLLSVAFVSGCVAPSPIKSEQQVGEAVTNISQNIEDVSSILDDIDKKLG